MSSVGPYYCIIAAVWAKITIVDYLRLDFLLVMEDLVNRGAYPRDATRPMTVDQVANGLRGLAAQ